MTEKKPFQIPFSDLKPKTETKVGVPFPFNLCPTKNHDHLPAHLNPCFVQECVYSLVRPGIPCGLPANTAQQVAPHPPINETNSRKQDVLRTAQSKQGIRAFKHQQSQALLQPTLSQANRNPRNGLTQVTKSLSARRPPEDG